MRTAGLELKRILQASIILAFILPLAFPPIVHAAGVAIPGTSIQFDSGGGTDNDLVEVVGAVSPTGTLSWSQSIGAGSGGILLAGVFDGDNGFKSVSAVTIGGKFLTLLTTSSTPLGEAGMSLWYMLNPQSVVGVGTFTVTAMLASPAQDVLGGSVSFFNVLGIGGSMYADGLPNVPIQLTIPANAGDFILDGLVTDQGSSATPGSGQLTGIGSFGGSGDTVNTSPSGIFVAGSGKIAASPVMMSWTVTGSTLGATSQGWALGAIDLQPSLIIPEYPVGLPLLAIFMIIGYAVINRKTTTRKVS